MDRVRVQRLIIYEGSRVWVERTVAKSVHGTREVGGSSTGPLNIFGVTLSPFPEVIPSLGTNPSLHEWLSAEKDRAGLLSDAVQRKGYLDALEAVKNFLETP